MASFSQYPLGLAKKQAPYEARAYYATSASKSIMYTFVMIKELGTSGSKPDKQREEIDRMVRDIGKTWSRMLDARRKGDSEELKKLAESLSRHTKSIADKIERNS